MIFILCDFSMMVFRCSFISGMRHFRENPTKLFDCLTVLFDCLTVLFDNAYVMHSYLFFYTCVVTLM